MTLNWIEFLKIVWHWKKPILLIVSLAAVGSVVLTDPRIMPPKYESTVLFYPLNPNLTSSVTLFSGGGDNLFGGTSEVDRMLSIAGSIQLKKLLIQKFRLFDHYKIDSSRERYPYHAVLKKLDAHYRYMKNDKGAIMISVLDRDRQLAADMANEAAKMIDSIGRALLNENKKKVLSIYEKKMQEKEKIVEQLTDSIFALKQEFGLYTDIRELPNQVQTVRGRQGLASDAAMERVKVLEEKKKGAIRELNNSIAMYEQYLATIDHDVPVLLVLEKAYPAEKKSKPIRWLIVMMSVIVAFAFSCLAVVLIAHYRSFRQIFVTAT